MHLAVTAARRDDRAASVRWLLVTVAMGAVFIANQALEYAEASFQIDSHAYGSIFYLMTGFHGLHVIGGLLFLLIIAGVVGGRSRPPRSARWRWPPTTGTSWTWSGWPCSPSCT